jgi:hypothetical protein
MPAHGLIGNYLCEHPAAPSSTDGQVPDMGREGGGATNTQGAKGIAVYRAVRSPETGLIEAVAVRHLARRDHKPSSGIHSSIYGAANSSNSSRVLQKRFSRKLGVSSHAMGGTSQYFFPSLLIQT